MRNAVGGGMAIALAVVAAALMGCGGGEEAAEQQAVLALPISQLSSTLSDMGVGPGYRPDTAPVRGGQLAGRVVFAGGALPEDTLTRPTHDERICNPVPAAPIQGSADGVGQAVVWLVGVKSGPADSSSLRQSLLLSDCELSPRVQRVPVGATLIVRSDDDMDARLRILDAAAPEAEPRALVTMETEGALVPLTDVTARPGLLEIRDDRHPWVRGWIAVAPHPFVAVTGADGTFSFAGVPPGSYALVAWHERLGQQALPVLVELGVETRIVVTLGAP